MTLIRFGGYQPDRSVHTRAARLFGSELEKAVGSSVDFVLTPNIAADGRPVSDLLRLTEAGELELCYFASSYLSGRVPALNVLDLPFPDTDRSRLYARLDGAAGGMIADAVAATTGYQVIGYWDNGIRHVSNGVRPIRHPHDCKGLGLRTLDSRFQQDVYAAMGFTPRFIDVRDLPLAVRDRSIDAQENPLTNIINFEIEKTHKYVSLLGTFHGIALLLANRLAWQSWSPVVREAVAAAAAHATTHQRRLSAEEDATCLDLLRQRGVDVLGADAIDLAAFKAATAPEFRLGEKLVEPDLLAHWQR
jgi:TRAP-type C4-dicarboxylate transport system substrate-binding protein